MIRIPNARMPVRYENAEFIADVTFDDPNRFIVVDAQKGHNSNADFGE
jgi:hypothetical protein